MPHEENMTIICLYEALNVKNEAIWLPRELVIRTASVISFVLHRSKSQTKTMKTDWGIMLEPAMVVVK